MDMDKNAQEPAAKSKGFVGWVKRHPIITVIVVLFLIGAFSSAGNQPKQQAANAPAPSSASAGTSTQQTIPTPSAQQPQYKEIFTLKGKGNSNSESFSTSGGNLKVTARTTGSTVGSFSGIELKSDAGSYLENASLNISTEGSEAGTGETIIRNAKAGTYYISVISGVNWEVHVYEEK